MRFFLLTILLLVPLTSYGAPYPVILSTVPEHPAPGDRVTITATALGFDTQEATITWLLNDEAVAGGLGVDKIALTAPELGSEATIRVLVNGDEVAKPLVIAPMRVTIEWEALTPRPPHYIGKPLFGGQGSLRAVAIPELTRDGVRIPTGQIRFTWRLNNSILSDQSGYGANTVVVEPPFYDSPFSLSVEVAGGGSTAVSGVALRAESTDLVIYESTPLAGVLTNQEIGGDYDFTASESSFIAYALNVSRPESLAYQWKLNGTPIALDTGDPRVAVFKKTGEGSGAYEVSVELTNTNAFLDLFERAFLLHF